MKYLLELILTTVIVFFVWNYLQRIFFRPRRNVTQNRPQQSQKAQGNNAKHGLNWDAEEAEYEEVKEEEKMRR